MSTMSSSHETRSDALGQSVDVGAVSLMLLSALQCPQTCTVNVRISQCDTHCMLRHVMERLDRVVKKCVSCGASSERVFRHVPVTFGDELTTV